MLKCGKQECDFLFLIKKECDFIKMDNRKKVLLLVNF